MRIHLVMGSSNLFDRFMKLQSKFLHYHDPEAEFARSQRHLLFFPFKVPTAQP